MFVAFFYLLRQRGLDVSLNEWMTLLEGMEKGPAGNTSLAAAFSLAQELDQDQIIVAQETEYTGAGKHIQPQLAFARKNGIDILFGDPAEEIPGTNIILPARPSLLKAREADLDHMRKSLIRRQATRAAGPVTAAEIAYLAEETNSNDSFVQGVLKELGYELA